ncbi:MAG: hypothetical protein LQ352_005194 [Teloschistes flavicans]|nr:MAG: hypothetical protein LQ352_005194 [Teloschistes flavicans]
MYVALVLILCVCQAIAVRPPGLKCYPSNAPLAPVTISDCLSVIEWINEGDKADAPINFSRDKQRGFKVPHNWLNDSCVVVIDVEDGRDMTMTMAQIAFAAAKIMAYCFGRHGLPDLGGRDNAGPELQMMVILAGLKRRSPSNLGDPLPNMPLQLGSQWNNTLSEQHDTA